MLSKLHDKKQKLIQSSLLPWFFYFSLKDGRYFCASLPIYSEVVFDLKVNIFSQQVVKQMEIGTMQPQA